MIARKDTKKSRSTTVVNLNNDPEIHYPGKEGHLKIAVVLSALDGTVFPADPRILTLTMSKLFKNSYNYR